MGDRSGEPAGGLPYVWKPDAAEFGGFVHALGVRYSGHYTPPGASSPLPRAASGRLERAQLWPRARAAGDRQLDCRGGPVSVPRAARRRLDLVAADRTRHDRMLFGELAPRGRTTGDNPGNFSGMVPLRFVARPVLRDSTLNPLQGTAAAERECPTTAADS